jgi:CheY-like chemotaxis protein
MLRKRGHTVTIVDNGAKAVDAVKGSTFDLVLMDIHMPEMDGLAATAAIRKLAGGAGLPIIALTADALTGEWQHCLAAGMSGYLAKPFNSRDLIAMVEGWGPPSAAATQELDDAPAPADLEQFQNMMREAGVEHAVGDILNTFIAEAPRRCSDLAAAIAAEHAGDIRAAAHAFKSAVGTIGARSLFSILVGIEQAGKDNRIHDARALEPSMHRECDAVIAYLRGRRAGEPTHA